MARVSKKEYEEVLNKLFGTNIKWSKLSYAELEELTERLSADDVSVRCQICEKLQCKQYRYLIVDVIDRIGEEHQGPILKGIKKLGRMLEKMGLDITEFLPTEEPKD